MNSSAVESDATVTLLYSVVLPCGIQVLEKSAQACLLQLYAVCGHVFRNGIEQICHRQIQCNGCGTLA